MDKEALQNELDQLYAVRTRLLTGSQRENVRYGDRSVQYTRVDMDRLEARIRSIEAELGINTANRRRAIGVCFG